MGKPNLVLSGGRDRGPTLEELVAMFKQLTGRDPSAEELADVKAEMSKAR